MVTFGNLGNPVSQSIIGLAVEGATSLEGLGPQKGLAAFLRARSMLRVDLKRPTPHQRAKGHWGFLTTQTDPKRSRIEVRAVRLGVAGDPRLPRRGASAPRGCGLVNRGADRSKWGQGTSFQPLRSTLVFLGGSHGGVLHIGSGKVPLVKVLNKLTL